MNPILKQYFDRLKSHSFDGELNYHIFKRDEAGSVPYSVHFFSKVDSHTFRSSWGNGKDLDEAFGKALMEMIERIYFSGISPFQYKQVYGLFKKSKTLEQLSKDYKIQVNHLHPSNTNGVSIHLTLKAAIKSAMLELIERHTILFCLANNVSPHMMREVRVTENKTCSYYTWSAPQNTFVTVGAYSQGAGTYFSSGCDFSLEASISKAALELNSFLFLDERCPDDHRIIKNDIQSFNRYHRFSGDHSALEFLNTRKRKHGSIPDLDRNKFYYTRIPVPHTFKGLFELPVVRVIHPDVQQLFFDNWKLEYLNPRVFSQDVKLPNYPHIIA